MRLHEFNLVITESPLPNVDPGNFHRRLTAIYLSTDIKVITNTDRILTMEYTSGKYVSITSDGNQFLVSFYGNDGSGYNTKKRGTFDKAIGYIFDELIRQKIYPATIKKTIGI